jgi:hypothetical protein
VQLTGGDSLVLKQGVAEPKNPMIANFAARYYGLEQMFSALPLAQQSRHVDFVPSQGIPEKLFLLDLSQIFDDIQYSFSNNLLRVARHIQ